MDPLPHMANQHTAAVDNCAANQVAGANSENQSLNPVPLRP